MENAAHSNRSQTADYALLSYGPDGHGGYLKSGTRYNAGVSNVDEDADAHYSNAGADTGYTATYVQKEYSTYAGDSDASHPFGHIVRFKERWQMQNAYDVYRPNGLPCWPGFAINNYITGTAPGFSAVAVGDVNGDGIPDLIIGSGYNTGTDSIFVVFGTRSGFPDPLPLSSCNGSNCAELNGPGSLSFLGSAAAIADVNGDGIADIISGGSGGAVHLIIPMSYSAMPAPGTRRRKPSMPPILTASMASS